MWSGADLSKKELIESICEDLDDAMERISKAEKGLSEARRYIPPSKRRYRLLLMALLLLLRDGKRRLEKWHGYLHDVLRGMEIGNPHAFVSKRFVGFRVLAFERDVEKALAILQHLYPLAELLDAELRSERLRKIDLDLAFFDILTSLYNLPSVLEALKEKASHLKYSWP